MTSSVTVAVKRKRVRCDKRWKSGLRRARANWNCTRKRRIVYCKDTNRLNSHPEQRFDFLGFTFRPGQSMNRTGNLFVSFSPAVSDKAAKAMREVVRRWKLHHRSDLDLGDIARWTRPMLLGWVRYYGRFHRSALRSALRTLDQFIVRWA